MDNFYAVVDFLNFDCAILHFSKKFSDFPWKSCHTVIAQFLFQNQNFLTLPNKFFSKIFNLLPHFGGGRGVHAICFASCSYYWCIKVRQMIKLIFPLEVTAWLQSIGCISIVNKGLLI